MKFTKQDLILILSLKNTIMILGANATFFLDQFWFPHLNNCVKLYLAIWKTNFDLKGAVSRLGTKQEFKVVLMLFDIFKCFGCVFSDLLYFNFLNS